MSYLNKKGWTGNIHEDMKLIDRMKGFPPGHWEEYRKLHEDEDQPGESNWLDTEKSNVNYEILEYGIAYRFLNYKCNECGKDIRTAMVEAHKEFWDGNGNIF
jgi:hypothetical protein